MAAGATPGEADGAGPSTTGIDDSADAAVIPGDVDREALADAIDPR